MDRGPDATSGRRSRVLEDVLRWVADEKGGRHGAGLHISPRHTHEVHGLSLFPLIQYVAEYEALINGLHIAIELGIQRLDIQGHS